MKVHFDLHMMSMAGSTIAAGVSSAGSALTSVFKDKVFPAVVAQVSKLPAPKVTALQGGIIAGCVLLAASLRVAYQHMRREPKQEASDPALDEVKKVFAQWADEPEQEIPPPPPKRPHADVVQEALIALNGKPKQEAPAQVEPVRIPQPTVVAVTVAVAPPPPAAVETPVAGVSNKKIDLATMFAVARVHAAIKNKTPLTDIDPATRERAIRAMADFKNITPAQNRPAQIAPEAPAVKSEAPHYNAPADEESDYEDDSLDFEYSSQRNNDDGILYGREDGEDEY